MASRRAVAKSPRRGLAGLEALGSPLATSPPAPARAPVVAAAPPPAAATLPEAASKRAVLCRKGEPIWASWAAVVAVPDDATASAAPPSA